MENSSHLTILIVEDDPALSGNVALILRMEGFRVISAVNGAEGLAAIRSWRPDLILCDILMPEVDGFAFHQAVSANEELAGIPFIFISALNDLDHLRKGMQAGADDYLCKPFSAEQLVAAVTARLQRFAKLAASAEKPTIDAAQLRALRSVSHRELQVLQMVAKGMTTRQIAELLDISPKTVEVHRSRLMKKLEATNAAILVHWAVLADQALRANLLTVQADQVELPKTDSRSNPKR
ncbi:MAG: response regulator transcription factor [Leptonema illini]|uniref:Response regulator transcription factor n=1 Tax=Leptonema illini TaxID=183 RepID=A0A833LVR4_9LEPT|nr:MAG: response regulator transcription factor [Leptonema illini]